MGGKFRTLALYGIATWIGLRAGWWFGVKAADTFIAINRNGQRTPGEAREQWYE